MGPIGENTHLASFWTGQDVLGVGIVVKASTFKSSIGFGCSSFGCYSIYGSNFSLDEAFYSENFLQISLTI